MASKGFTHIDLFNDNSGGWTLSNATISGGLLNITTSAGYGRRSPDADWYSGASDNFILEVDNKVYQTGIYTFMVSIYLTGDANPICFYVSGSTNTMYIYYNGANRANQSYVEDLNWHTLKFRRIGTVYYYSIDGGAEISWNYGTARAINYFQLGMDEATGEYDNFKYSWIKAVLEGAISFVGAVSKKQFKILEGVISFIGMVSSSRLFKKLLEGGISFIGTLQKKLTLHRLLEGTLNFIGTLQRKLSLHRLLEGSISFIGTLLSSRLFKKILEGSISFIGILSRKLTFKRTLEGKISFIGKLKIRRFWRAVSKMSNIWTPKDKRNNVWIPQDKRDNDWTEE